MSPEKSVVEKVAVIQVDQLGSLCIMGDLVEKKVILTSSTLMFLIKQ